MARKRSKTDDEMPEIDLTSGRWRILGRGVAMRLIRAALAYALFIVRQNRRARRRRWYVWEWSSLEDEFIAAAEAYRKSVNRAGRGVTKERTMGTKKKKVTAKKTTITKRAKSNAPRVAKTTKRGAKK